MSERASERVLLLGCVCGGRVQQGKEKQCSTLLHDAGCWLQLEIVRPSGRYSRCEPWCTYLDEEHAGLGWQQAGQWMVAGVVFS